MRRLGFFLLVVMLMAIPFGLSEGCASRTASYAHTSALQRDPNAFTIVTLGDSNTDHTPTVGDGSRVPVTRVPWPSRVLDGLKYAYPGAQYRLQNSGVSGIGTTQAAQHVDDWCLEYEPDIVIVMLGSNDLPTGDAQITSNLTGMIRRIQAVTFSHSGNPWNHPLVLLMQPPIAANGNPDMTKSSQGFPSQSQGGYYEFGFNTPKLIHIKDLVGTIAARTGSRLVPVWDNLASFGWEGYTNQQDQFLGDGAHLNDLGQQMVATYAYQALRLHLGSCHRRLPGWNL